MLSRMQRHRYHERGSERERKTENRWKDLCNRNMESVVLKIWDVTVRQKMEQKLSKTILRTLDDGKSQR